MPLHACQFLIFGDSVLDAVAISSCVIKAYVRPVASRMTDVRISSKLIRRMSAGCEYLNGLQEPCGCKKLTSTSFVSGRDRRV